MEVEICNLSIVPLITQSAIFPNFKTSSIFLNRIFFGTRYLSAYKFSICSSGSTIPTISKSFEIFIAFSAYNLDLCPQPTIKHLIFFISLSSYLCFESYYSFLSSEKNSIWSQLVINCKARLLPRISYVKYHSVRIYLKYEILRKQRRSRVWIILLCF